jgi:hypothetical protein
MTHDPLCPSVTACDCRHEDCCFCDSDAWCICRLIEKVRADERREVALSLRFAAKIQAVDGTAIDATNAELLRRCADIIAVRGES